MSISSADDTNSTKESDGEYDSVHDPHIDMRMENDVDAPDVVDLDRDLHMERDSDDEEEEYEEEKDKLEDDEDEEENENEDDGKKNRMISHGEMVNTSADDVVTMVDEQPIVLPEQGQEMRNNTPQPQPPAPAPWPQTPDFRPRPPTPETHPISGLDW